MDVTVYTLNDIVNTWLVDVVNTLIDVECYCCTKHDMNVYAAIPN